MENLLKQSIMYLVIKELEEEYKNQIKKEQDSLQGPAIDPNIMCLKCHQRGHINCNEMREDNIYKIN